MRTKSSRYFIYSGFIYLIIWLGSALYRTFTSSGFYSPITFLEIEVAIFGFISMIIFGMSYHLIPFFSGRMLISENGVYLHLFIAHLGFASLVPGLFIQVNPAEKMFPYIWTVGVFIYVVNIVATLLKEKTFYFSGNVTVTLSKGENISGLNPGNPKLNKIDKIATLYTIFSVIYLIGGSVLFAGDFVPLPVIIHLFTTGFIMLMVLGSAYHLIPRFMNVTPSLTVVGTGLAGVIAPALFGISLMGFTDKSIFIAGAILEFFAVAVLALSIIYMTLKSRLRKTTHIYYLSSATFMLIGLGLGVLFAVHYRYMVYVPVHAILNLFGAVGFLIFGVSFDALFLYLSYGDKVKNIMSLILAFVSISALITFITGYIYLNKTILQSGMTLLFASGLLYGVGLVLSPGVIGMKKYDFYRPVEITPEMRVDDCIRQFPGTRALFESLGMCTMYKDGPPEKISFFARVHNYDINEFIKELNIYRVMNYEDAKKRVPKKKLTGLTTDDIRKAFGGVKYD